MYLLATTTPPGTPGTTVPLDLHADFQLQERTAAVPSVTSNTGKGKGKGRSAAEAAPSATNEAKECLRLALRENRRLLPKTTIMMTMTTPTATPRCWESERPAPTSALASTTEQRSPLPLRAPQSSCGVSLGTSPACGRSSTKAWIEGKITLLHVVGDV